MKKVEIKLRKLNDTDEDYRLLEKWYQEEEIYSHFEQRKLNYDEIKKKYFARTLKESKIPVFMIEYQDIPIGIIQYQLINSENKKLYGLEVNNCYEIDIFIGEIELHNKGIGQKSLDLMCNYLLKEKNPNLLVMCPLKNNIKAIKCYEKCGFNIVKEFETEDTIGDLQKFVLMVKEC